MRNSKNADAFFSSFRSYDLLNLEDEKIFIRKSSNSERFIQAGAAKAAEAKNAQAGQTK